MAKKIVWTQTAIQDRFRIYHHWTQKNKSNLFSEKLEGLFNEAATLLSEFSEIGTQTDFKDLRVKVIRHYKLFYHNQPDRIQIIRVWDSRQNPDNLKLE
ncbi:MAG: type II toxin-antitoxin system RelE/ParE family toxin [Cyclobacteriaceae bacterium]